jgi:hypothetical protein
MDRRYGKLVMTIALAGLVSCGKTDAPRSRRTPGQDKFGRPTNGIAGVAAK